MSSVRLQHILHGYGAIELVFDDLSYTLVAICTKQKQNNSSKVGRILITCIVYPNDRSKFSAFAAMTAFAAAFAARCIAALDRDRIVANFGSGDLSCELRPLPVCLICAPCVRFDGWSPQPVTHCCCSSSSSSIVCLLVASVCVLQKRIHSSIKIQHPSISLYIPIRLFSNSFVIVTLFSKEYI